MVDELDRRIEDVAGLLRQANSPACLTGAGVSAESGIPTFRDAQTGLWSRLDPEKLASVAGFRSDPGLVWRWYMARLSQIEKAQPNAGHLALVDLERQADSFHLITQNVDNLHERAGHKEVIHLHGQVSRYRCLDCARPYTLTQADRKAQLPPQCNHCRSYIRPDVIWFGEILPYHAIQAAFEVCQSCDLLLVIGTSGIVYPAARLPMIARDGDAIIVEINPDPPVIFSATHIYLQGRGGDILPRLVDAM